MSNDALLLAAQCEASGDTTTASVMRELVAEIERRRAATPPAYGASRDYHSCLRAGRHPRDYHGSNQFSDQRSAATKETDQ